MEHYEIVHFPRCGGIHLEGIHEKPVIFGTAMKRNMIMAFCLLLILCLFRPVAARAVEVTGSGTCGENVTWTLTEDGTLTISGEGAMADYEFSYDAPWDDYRDIITRVVIEHGVTNVGKFAFLDFTALTEVILPESVTIIDSDALKRCTALEEIVIPEGVQIISNYAFAQCESLKKVTIPTTLVESRTYAFYQCHGLEEIHIRDLTAWCGVSFACEDANPLYEAEKLYLNGALVAQLYLPDSVTRIGDYAFVNYPGLTSIDVAADIGKSAFYQCPNLKTVTLRSGTTTIGENGFGRCGALEILYLPPTLNSIPDYYSFSQTTNLREVHITDAGAWSQVEIEQESSCPMQFGAKLYLNGAEIVDLVIPEGVTKIGTYAFYRCESIKTVTLPKTLREIGDFSFFRCNALEGVYISDLSAWCGVEISHVSNPLQMAKKLYLNGELLTRVDVPEGITYLGSGVFTNCSDITDVTLPDSVTSIHDHAFYGCSGLERIRLSKNLEEIGGSAFSGCTSLETAELPAGLKRIGRQAFYKCGSLTGIALPDSVEEIGQSAFEGCASITSICIPDGITEIESSTFSGCTSLSRIELPRRLKAIGIRAFHACAITSILIPENVYTMEFDVFPDCDLLEKVFFLGEAPAEANEKLFFGAPETLTVYYPADAAGWEGDTWRDRPAKSWSFEITSTATCTNGGVETITSAEHDLVYTRTVLPLNHTFKNWELQTRPTTQSTGLWISQCEYCDATDTIEIPVLVDTEQTPAITDNVDDQSYTHYHANPVKSHLKENPEGGYIRVENLGEYISVEYYDEQKCFVSRMGIPMELGYYGGFYCDGEWNYIVFAQNNANLSSDVAVFRVVKYSLDFCRIGCVDMFSNAIQTPCYSGSLRITHSGNALYVASCFNSGHQFSCWFSVNTQTMELMSAGHAAASHSFNQFVQTDGESVYIIDHGDFYPRALLLSRYPIQPGGVIHGYHRESLELMKFEFEGEAGSNYTGCEIGGFELTGQTAIVAGCSVLQDGIVDRITGQKNVFVTVTDLQSYSLEETQTIWLTSYEDGAQIRITAPHLVKINEDQLCILWMENDTLCYAFLNGQGQIRDNRIYRTESQLSDCKPIISGNTLCWYVTDRSIPFFYTIDLNAPESVQQFHEHEYRYKLGVAPTEQAEGRLNGTCRYCEATDTKPMPLVSEQDYSSEVTREPTCANPGTCRYTWKDETYGVFSFDGEIPTIDHTPVEDPAIPATCTRDGRTAGSSCQVCLMILVPQEKVPFLGHDYQSVVTEATCTEGGYTTHTCTRCGKTYTDQRTRARGHSYGEWVETKAPTCTEAGEQTRTCVCGLSETRTVDALRHDYVGNVTSPTCTENGYTTYVCSRCGDSYTGDETSRRGHSYGEWTEAKTPTCTNEGEETRTCFCGASENRPIDPLGHDHQAVVTPPTCTEDGYTTYTCTWCGDFYVEDESLATGHTYGDWTETQVPTCMEAGEEIRICTCGASETRAVDPMGHAFGEWYTTIEPTEEMEGEQRRDCLRCDKHDTEILPKLDHVHSYEAVVTEASCTEGGFTTFTCKCGDRYVAGETSALGHELSGWNVTTPAACTADGEEQRNCSRCDYSETRAIAAVGHSYQDTVTAPTCTEQGNTTHTCVTCGDSYVDGYTTALDHAFVNGVCSRCGAEDPDYLVQHSFTDVSDAAWYYEPVLWAVKKEITAGTGAGQFSPDQNCTRAQVVTFLWRAMGKPEPASEENPFTDVKPGDYYYDAVLWAVENGITSGTGVGRFSPDDSCTRAQVVTFLWRAMGQVEPESNENPFADVKQSDYYFAPVLWAVETEITAGTGGGKFSPDASCTRAQVVTFLYRAIKDQ